MKTLYQKLKPEIKAKLKENAEEYAYGPRHVIAELHRFTNYSELKMGTITDLLMWGDVSWSDWDKYDIKYGDKLFNNE